MDTDRDPRLTVAVHPGAAIASSSRLFAALEAAFPVAFKPLTAVRGNAAALIRMGEGDLPAERDPGPEPELPTLAFSGPGGARHPGADVRLGEGNCVDQRVRGISVREDLDGQGIPTPHGSLQEVLAFSDSRPAWTRSRGPVSIHRVRSTLPELGPSQALRDLFPERTLALIALTQFLREVSGDASFNSPGLRAAILFDDPNLRWRTYGFIAYHQLLQHAEEHGYHAAIAMIPLDGWRQHRATVELFRKRRDRLSLVFHGNNHVARELMQPADEANALAVGAQAIRRAIRFESRYRLGIDRIMTPPHGMCSASMARALGDLGFDALCAIHPLPWSERVPADRPLAGWDPAELGDGCANIPRIPLQTEPSEIAVRAFLGHPLILYGHHDDLSEGLDLLAETASRVNRLGEVEWTSLREIALSNHADRLDGRAFRVRPYSHRLRVRVPEEADYLVIERPRDPHHGLVGWAAQGTDASFDAEVPCGPGDVELRLRPLHAVDPAQVPSPLPRFWPVLRRFGTEARDRLRPLLQAGPA